MKESNIINYQAKFGAIKIDKEFMTIYLYDEHNFEFSPLNEDIIDDIEIDVDADSNIAYISGMKECWKFTIDPIYIDEKDFGKYESKYIGTGKKSSIFKSRRKEYHYINSGWYKMKETVPYNVNVSKYNIISYSNNKPSKKIQNKEVI